MACGSQRRDKYNRTRDLGPGTTWKPLPGIPKGTRYTQLKKRHTRCTDCGQSRVDECFEFDPRDLVRDADDRRTG